MLEKQACTCHAPHEMLRQSMREQPSKPNATPGDSTLLYPKMKKRVRNSLDTRGGASAPNPTQGNLMHGEILKADIGSPDGGPNRGQRNLTQRNSTPPEILKASF
jgi:hypothetical protein